MQFAEIKIMQVDPDPNFEKNVHLLLNIVSDEIEEAFRSGDAILYGELGEKYGKIAHRIYMALDMPSKSSEWGFFDNPHKSVLLDPWTIMNRKACLLKDGEDVTVYDPVFWNHSDLIVSLINYISLIYKNEAICA